MVSFHRIWRRRSALCCWGSTVTRPRNQSTARSQTSESPPMQLQVCLCPSWNCFQPPTSNHQFNPTLWLHPNASMLVNTSFTFPHKITSSVLIVFTSSAAAAAAAALSDRSPQVNLNRSTSSASGIHRSTEDLRSRQSSSLGRLRESTPTNTHIQGFLGNSYAPVVEIPVSAFSHQASIYHFWGPWHPSGESVVFTGLFNLAPPWVVTAVKCCSSICASLVQI